MDVRQRKTNCKKLVSICLLIAMLVTSIGSVFGSTLEVNAAKKRKVALKFNKTSVKLQTGQKTTVKLKKTNIKKIKKKKWSVKNKKIAKVTKKGVVTGIRAGKTTVTCKVKYLAKGEKKQKSKTLKCKITVTPSTASGTTSKPSIPAGPNISQQPAITLQPDNSADPSGSSAPGTSADPSVSSAPGTSADPSVSSAPGTSAGPSVSSVPGTSADPSVSSAPGTSADPSASAAPGTSADPSASSAPGTSADPSASTAPGSSADPDSSKDPAASSAPNITEKPVTTSKPETTGTPASTPAPSAANTPAPTSGFEMSSLDFAAQLGAGINIGNSLDSNQVNDNHSEENDWQGYPMKDLYLSGDAGLALETAWGNSEKITKEFIHGIKEAGFQTIRLPVTYINHVKTETINGKKKYTIDADWLNRVQEIVDWALEEGLYIIINIHHDGSDNCDSDGNLNVYGGEQASWLSPLNNSEEAYAQMEAKFVSLWEQIANKFKGHSDHLLFADMNEFHHGYNAPSQTWCDVQNKLHQAFVDTVRSTGDNNAKRHLIVPGYNTNIDQTISGLVVPTDIPENQTTYQGNTVGHIMVEVHYYDPYTYAGDDPSDTLWGQDAGEGAATWGQEDFLDGQMQKMNTNYVAKGIPVIIGEFGAPEHKIDTETDRIYRTYYYSCVVKSAVQNGLVPITWDNGTSYKLLNRDGTIAEQSIVDAIIKYTKTPSAEIVKPTAN